jgi:hypothetical protein
MEKIEITLATENIPLSMQITQVSEKLDYNAWNPRLRLIKHKRKKDVLHLEYEMLRGTVPPLEKQYDVPSELTESE